MVTAAIFGWVSTIAYTPGGNIGAFTIDATVTNDLLFLEVGNPGSNAHNEFNTSPVPYAGPMARTKICAEFAISGPSPAQWVNPYFDDISVNIAGIPNPYYIQATNQNQDAWYCWTPGAPAPMGPAGGYYVPAWDLGFIPVGGSATVQMQFVITGVGGMPPADPRFNVLVMSNLNQLDVLWNRSQSLKISEWIDGIDLDPLGTSVGRPMTESNASVFFIPEPATLCLLLLGACALRRKRRG
jgi:hypothetical protein